MRDERLRDPEDEHAREARLQALLRERRHREARALIRGVFECPQRWTELAGKGSVRDCEACGKSVSFAQDEAEIQALSSQGHCIAAPRDVFRAFVDSIVTRRRALSQPGDPRCIVDLPAERPEGPLELDIDASVTAQSIWPNARVVVLQDLADPLVLVTDWPVDAALLENAEMRLGRPVTLRLISPSALDIEMKKVMDATVLEVLMGDVWEPEPGLLDEDDEEDDAEPPDDLDGDVLSIDEIFGR